MPDLNKSFLQYIAILNSGSFSWLNSATAFFSQPSNIQDAFADAAARAQGVLCAVSMLCLGWDANLERRLSRFFNLQGPV